MGLVSLSVVSTDQVICFQRSQWQINSLPMKLWGLVALEMGGGSSSGGVEAIIQVILRRTNQRVYHDMPFKQNHHKQTSMLSKIHPHMQ